MSARPLSSSYATSAGAWPARARAARGAGSRVLRRMVEMLLAWSERARQRRQLQMLSDRMLQDIGLSRADVEREAGKPFWRP